MDLPHNEIKNINLLVVNESLNKIKSREDFIYLIKQFTNKNDDQGRTPLII